MHKNRIIFTLLFGDGFYNLSRNFRLQRVGDLSWVRENYEFDSIARSIDELVILDVSRATRDHTAFSGQVEQLGKNCFMPIAAGGGIRTTEHAFQLFQAGADKLVLNTPFFTQPNLVEDLVSIFGSQSIIASIDYRHMENGSRRVFVGNGTEDTGMELADALRKAQFLGAGEIYLTSINNDGTGIGFDLEALRLASEICSVPIIASGGADNPVHLIEGIRAAGTSAVSTAHLFNFMSDGLCEARKQVAENGIPLSQWPDNLFV
jgi:cyclase